MAFLGIKGGIKGFFDGVGKRIKKTVKRVGKGLSKAWKKMKKSKILKALAIAAAVIVTGGAAIGAFGGSLASSGFGTWMINAGNAITGFTLGGTTAAGTTAAFGTTATGGSIVAGTGLNVGAVLKPLAAVGKGLGTTARAVTDFTGLTDLAKENQAILESETSKLQDIGARMSDISERGSSEYLELQKQQLDQMQVVADTQQRIGGSPMTASTTETGFFDTTAGRVTEAVGTTVLGSTLSGVAANYIAGDPAPQGAMAGAAYEGASHFDPLRVYAAANNINTNDIYSHLLYGNSDPSTMYGNDLFKQQTFQVA